MRIKTLSVMAILLAGVVACGNPKPADPAATTAAAPEAAAPGNEVMPVPVTAPETGNTVTADPSTNAVTPPPPAPPPPPEGNAITDDSRSTPDRREGGATETK